MPPKNHFQKLDDWIRRLGAKSESFKEEQPTLYWICQILFWPIAAIIGYLSWQFCDEGGWVMIGVIAALLFLLFLVFAWDYVHAKQISYQFFFKPWIVIVAMLVVMGYLGSRRHANEQTAAQNLVDATNYFDPIISAFNTISNSQNSQLWEMRGKLTEAKSDLENARLMLAPCQAAALKIYTNEPMQSRLDLLAAELEGLSKGSDIHLFVNDSTNLIESDPSFRGIVTVSNFMTLTNRELFVRLINESIYPAIKGRADFLSDIDPTNFVTSDWVPQPSDANDACHWRYEADSSIPINFAWSFPIIRMSTNYTGNYFIAKIIISADNAKTREYFVGCTVPPEAERNKSVTNIVDKK